MHLRRCHSLLSRFAFTAAAVLSVTLAGRAVLGTRTEDPPGPAALPLRAGSPLALPVAFVPNEGQWDGRARYAARFGAATVFLCDDGWVASIPAEEGAAAVRMRFVGATASHLVPGAPTGGVESYFVGSDPQRWRTDLPRYTRVRYEAVQDGIDVVAYPRDGCFEYDLELAPGAELDRVEVEVEGADGLRLDADGALVLDTAAGPVRQTAPLTWETDDSGARRPVACRYELRGSKRFGFVAPQWSGSTRLTVDPGLVFSTYFGGAGQDACYAVDVDDSGIVTVAGSTRSTNFPLKLQYSVYKQQWEAFVARLDPSQAPGSQLLWSTCFGGAGDDDVDEMFVEPSSVVTIVGSTTSQNLPKPPAPYQPYQSALAGSWDGFIARLDPRKSGTMQLLASTYLGGSGRDVVYGVAVDTVAGRVAVGGWTESRDFPTSPGAFQGAYAGLRDAFVACLPLDLSALPCSTYLGGSDYDNPGGIAIDATGWITIVGATLSTDFPTTPGAYQRAIASLTSTDAFVARIDPSAATASQLVASTYYGGDQIDGGNAVAIDGTVTVAGNSSSTNLPTTPGAFQTVPGGLLDIMVFRFDALLQNLLYATRVGGPTGDLLTDLVVSPSGVVTIIGECQGVFPTTPGSFSPTINGPGDAVIARLDPARPAAEQLIYSTYFGGTGGEFGYALDVDSLGRAVFAGETGSLDLPTVNARQTAFAGGRKDGFVAMLDMLPTGARTFGSSSPGCDGPLPIGVSSWPQIGSATFSLTCDNTPASAPGFVVLGTALGSPAVILGVELWVTPVVSFNVLSTPRGSADFPLPLPNDPSLVGGQLSGQFLFVGPGAPAGCPPLGISASNAIEITIQN